MTERIAAIVLAGGRSSRFGRDKLAEPIDGRPMLEHVVDSIKPIVSEIVVAGPTKATPPLPPGAQLALDRVDFEGPLSGLGSALTVLDPSIERVLVVGGDMPTLVPVVLVRLLDALARHDAAVLADDDGPRPLPMALRRSVADPVVERLLAGGERRLRALLMELDVDVIPAAMWRTDDPDAATLRDVDVPGDLP